MSKSNRRNGRRGSGGGGGGLWNAAKRFMGLGGFVAPNMRQNLDKRAGAWIAAGEAFSTISQQRGVFWGGNTELATAPGSGASTNVCSVLAESPARVLSGGAAGQAVEKLNVKAIDGNVDCGILINWASGAFAAVTAVQFPVELQIGVGMYVGELNDGTNLYATQDPNVANDASRFDWIYHESRTVVYEPMAGNSGYLLPRNSVTCPKLFDMLDLAANVEIEPGEALMLSISVLGTGATKAGTSGDILATPLLNVMPSIKLFMGKAD